LKKTIYIGLNDNFHDPSIAIIDDEGVVLYAEGSERPLQYKRGMGCPADLEFYIDSLLEEIIDYKVDRLIVAYSWSRTSHLKAKILSVVNHFKNPNNLLFPDVEMSITRHVASLNQAGTGVVKAFKTRYEGIKIIKEYYNHHLCHIANAVSSTSIENGVGLVIDGKGDDTSYSYYRINKGEISLEKKITNYYSLGYLYGFFTELCGYSQLKGEEWKVMGLSGYGEKNIKLIEYFNNHIFNKILKLESTEINKKVLAIKKFIKNNNIPKEDIACVGQFFFEKLFFEVIDFILANNTKATNIFISGGSALNTLALGKLHEQGCFKNIVVPNAPADDGNALGAAVLAYKKEKATFPNNLFKIRTPYTGSKITEEQIEKYVKTSGLPFKKLENTSKYAAYLLHQNKIIGWIQGRAEFGPRALGNRSILAHPGYAENKDRINSVVKFREDYRPFAPSILHEFGGEYFEKYSFTPYMEKTLTFKEEVRGKVPAVVHVNNTGRLQSVTKEMNDKYYNLIYEFNKLSGIPLVVNTSYNVMGKPIVHDINDVMAVFFNSSIDAVIINDYVIEREKV
jgi:carbamoyltransferase